MTKILIVEDERIIAEDIKRTLINYGYEVLAITSSGKEAIEKAKELDPDLILMDIILKGDMSGIETVNKINQDIDIPVIFLTAIADESTIQSAKKVLPQAYIVKPFENEELHAAIEIAIVKHEAKIKLEESKAKFESIFMGNPEPSVYLDNDLHIISINPQFRRYFGYNLDEVKGKHIDDIIVHKEKLEEARELNLKMTKDQVYHDTLRKRKNGTLVPVSISAAPIIINNKICGSFVIYKDITKRKKAETEREKVITELKQALKKVKTLSGLIPICSHCKKVRDDSGYWQKVEEYLSQHSDVDFSHGICPDCLKKYYPDQYKKMKKKGTLHE